MRLPHFHFVLLLAASLLASLPSRAAADSDSLAALSLSQLEERLIHIDTELEQLARYSLRGGTGAAGYRSHKYLQPEAQESIRIELGETKRIDQVILVPSLWRDSQAGIRSEGFPSAFTVVAGIGNAERPLAAFTENDPLLPRIAPLSISFPAVEASWIRIDVSQYTPDIGDTNYSLQLSEILVFSGEENLALHKEVTIENSGSRRARESAAFLTDGFTPYLMDAAYGDRSQTQLVFVNDRLDTPPALTLDLQDAYPINQINLHTAFTALSIPMSYLNSWGVPRHIRLTGATKADFSDETLLFEHEQHSIEDTGPIIMQRFPETLARYIRITLLDHRPIVPPGTERPSIAFTEIEVLSAGRNIAVGAPISATANLTQNPVTFQRMTDGLNYFGTVLPIRDWLNQLARRHDLEAERPLVLAQLNQRYQRQKTLLQLLAWTVALLSVGTVVAILVGIVLRQRAVIRTRQHIAADLHDELGADLHAIGLFADLAKQEVAKSGSDSKWRKLVRFVEEMRSLTEQAGKTARYTTHMLESKELYENLPAEMKRTAERLLTDLEHEATFENEATLLALSRRKRISLFLFYKECLVNIIRHSGATRAETRLSATPKEIQLSVYDNGLGLSQRSSLAPPPSLARRARLLKAKLSVESPPEGGTRIKLTLKTRPWPFLKPNTK